MESHETHPYDQFLQSEDWAQFQESYGRKVLRISTQYGIASAIRYPLPFGFSYWFIPRGPSVQADICGCDIHDYFLALGETIHTNDPRAVFVRMEPTTDITGDAWKAVRAACSAGGARLVPHIHPAVTRLIDLSQTESEILKQMSDSTRRNITVAAKRGVVVSEETSESGLDALWSILSQMSGRQKISLHEKNYYSQMLAAFSKEPSPLGVQASIYVARFENTPIAAGLIIRYRGVATYLHGASGDLYRDKKAQYALRWLVMTESKKHGCHTLDFFGENPSDPKDHDYRKAWQGFTLFKAGFGGTQIRLPGTFEYPIKPILYTLYQILKRFR